MNWKSFLVTACLFMVVGCGSLAMAQGGFNIQNIAQVDIEKLSDEQIRSMVAQAAAAGYSEEQFYLLAETRGMSPLQIEQLKNRINQLGMQDGGSLQTTTTTGESRLRQSPMAGEDSLRMDTLRKPRPEARIDGLPVFGMSFFNNQRVSFDQSLNIPTPQNYLIGPGDEILIDVWGAFEYSYDLFVNPEGAIRIPDVGPVYLNGLKMDEATEKIKARLKSIYSTLGENSFADVSLGQIKTITVNIVGEAENPGSYPVSSFATAFSALSVAGGPAINGSFRVIDIFRNGQRIATLDAYQYLALGQGENIALQDQDVILIRPYLNRVRITGEVKRPAVYELKPGETLSDLLLYCGGFTGEAYFDVVTLRRNTGNFKAVSTVDKANFDQLVMQNGDAVEIRKISDLFMNRITLKGAVFQPGEFELTEGLDLEELIEKAGGLRGDAFTSRILIHRQNPDYSFTSFAVNLESISENEEILLKKEDIIYIQSIYDLREAYFIQIKGEVMKPGKYAFERGQTVEDLILLAGGFKESAAKSFVEVARRSADQEIGKIANIYNFPINESLILNDSASDFELQPFDLVSIRKNPYYEEQVSVVIEGEVLYPGTYALAVKDETISDLLKRAGGLTRYAYPKGATLVRRTTFFDADQESTTAEIRRDELRDILRRDALLDRDETTLKPRESIGIDLDIILKAPGSEEDLTLKEGDIVHIPRQLQTVGIRGEVLHPSKVRYGSFYSFQDFISQAGGFTDNAKKSKAYVVYPNGYAERTKKFMWFKFYPEVEPGSEIVVPQKPIKLNLRPTEIVGIASGLGTLALIVSQIINTN